MLVCWEWLSQYVDLNVDADDLANRFAMTGLNHESTTQVGHDTVIDLEVTSNRGDCLGHIGVAREAAVILQTQLRIPAAQPPEAAAPAADCLQVSNLSGSGCPRYTARVIRGVQVGPSPQWLVRRLAAVGIASVNNVVDVTNYVMLECGQPLHAFDLQRIQGGKIVVRAARDGEQLVAIDHRTYTLDAQMIVISDAQRPVAIAGVMGGADSEVSADTTDLVIEAATFEPLAVRRAARLLKLHSPSSFRFERRPDPAGVDWASRRCCELILQTAGGQLCSGSLAAGEPPEPRQAIAFRLAQVPRLLGIEVPTADIQRILTALGCQVSSTGGDSLAITPPTWRGDLSREVDLIEEVARMYGYDQIPEDVSVPLHVADIRPKDLAMARIRHTLSAYGIDEAMTASVVPESFEKLGSPWTDRAPLETETALLVGSRWLRRSLLPSLLAARYSNQAQAIRNAQLYESANIFLPAAEATGLPVQQSVLGIVTAGELPLIKGIVEEILAQVAGSSSPVNWQAATHPLFADGSLQQVRLGQNVVGYVGLVSRSAQQAMDLDQPVAAAELSLDQLSADLHEVRQASPVSPFPAVSRDLNFVVDESVPWSDFSAACRAAASPLLQEVRYQETYRNPDKDGVGKKRLLISLQFQSFQRTLTSEEVDVEVAQIIAACGKQFAAALLA